MRTNTPMTIDQIRSATPAVFATSGHPARVSNQYSFVSTEQVLHGMLDAGYGVFRAQQKHTQAKEDMPYTRHILGFRPLGWNQKAEATPEILMLSAHDAKCSFQLMAGLFRFVCCNGMIVGERFETIRTTHKGDIVQEVKDAAEKIVEFAPRLEEFQTRCLSTTLSKAKSQTYAQKAMQIRHQGSTPYEPAELLTVRRDEDKGADLWHTYQRVQENLMRGGIAGLSATGRATVSRPINRVTKDVIYNRALWDLTEEFAKAA